MIRTITAKMVSSILADDFSAAYLLSDSEDRSKFLAIEPGELDVLSERIQLVKTELISRTKKRQDEAKAAVTNIFDQIKDNVEFTTVEELIAALSGTAPVVSEEDTTTDTTTDNKTKSSSSNNKVFNFTFNDRDSGKNFSGVCTNGKVDATTRKSKEYAALLERDPSMKDIDTFLRKYSEEYQKAYPLNATYNGVEFHLNNQGKLNRSAQVQYEEWLNRTKTAESKDALKQFKETVLTK
ncbi:MAG: hypothetical protein E7I59_01160 [Phytobacter diazotrophicus]|nr:hypothetical protein [Phytobacter diazotrophicus]